jgi:hypothetical protein
MLNLNAMFGSCESIFETNVSRKNEYKVSPTELQMMEMEISADLARSEVDNAKISATTMQLDQLLNMYNHVKRFGVDRTFLSLYNSNNQLNNLLGVKFPSCESINSVGNANSNMSRAFILAMEDENEGIFAKIIKGIKWVWEKIKYLCTVVWKKIKSWVSSSGITKRLAKCEQRLNALPSNAKGRCRVFTNKKVAIVVGIAITALGVLMAYNKTWNPIKAITAIFKHAKSETSTNTSSSETSNTTEKCQESSKKCEDATNTAKNAKEQLGTKVEDVTVSQEREELKIAKDLDKQRKEHQQKTDELAAQQGQSAGVNLDNVKPSADNKSDVIAAAKEHMENAKREMTAFNAEMSLLTQISTDLTVYCDNVDEFCKKVDKSTILSADEKSEIKRRFKEKADVEKSINDTRKQKKYQNMKDIKEFKSLTDKRSDIVDDNINFINDIRKRHINEYKKEHNLK